jgi:hypothetical protein
MESLVTQRGKLMMALGLHSMFLWVRMLAINLKYLLSTTNIDLGSNHIVIRRFAKTRVVFGNVPTIRAITILNEQLLAQAGSRSFHANNGFPFVGSTYTVATGLGGFTTNESNRTKGSRREHDTFCYSLATRQRSLLSIISTTMRSTLRVTCSMSHVPPMSAVLGLDSLRPTSQRWSEFEQQDSLCDS